ncbi:putative DNA primase/helicase [Methanococcoides vulcani]|uniref:Putative DNA primase/helicase n=1 Tax=Methanococcoides vulcani TaxID=1353158 RepID=A0A1I0AA09_9EURY|nr:phage/plasmid primase, P4 family [Methanococcoides vulcani]SES90962.1 putative DNA primase/helicase [Methanococcoides vulcani]
MLKQNNDAKKCKFDASRNRNDSMTDCNSYLKSVSKDEAIDIKAVADDILSHIRVLHIQETGETLYYKDGRYVKSGEWIIRREIQRLIGSYADEKTKRDIISYICDETRISRDDLDCDPDVINLENVLYDVKTGEFREHSPEFLSTIQIPVVYVPGMSCPLIMKTLTELLPPEDLQICLEFLGYCLTPKTNMKKALMLLGLENTGKSVLMDLATYFLGVDNTSRISLQKMSYDKYATSRFDGTLLNCYSDIDWKKTSSLSVFKEVTGERFVHAEEKYGTSYEFNNMTKHMFAASRLPHGKYLDSVFLDRWLVINLKHQYKGKDADVDLIDKLNKPDELSGLLNLVLNALKGLRERGYFKHADKSAKILDALSSDTASVQSFVKDVVTRKKGHSIYKSDMYAAYANWCNSSLMVPTSKIGFGRAFSGCSFNGDKNKWHNCSLKGEY